MALLDTLIGAGSSIIGGVLGGASGGSDQKTGQSNSSVAPWSVQQPFLKTGFNSAAGLYGKYLDQPWYQGQLYAGMNPMQQAAGYGAGQYAMGQGMTLAQGMVNDSQPYLAQSGNFLNAANRAAGT